MKRFAQGWAFIVRLFSWIGLLGLVALTLVTLFDVAMKSGLGRPILGLNELFVILGAASVTAFMPFGLAARQLLSVRFLGGFAGPRISRGLDRLGDVATLGFFAVLLWCVYIYTANVVANNETTYLLGLVIGPWWIWSVICLIACVITQILVLSGHLTEQMLTPRGLHEAGPTDAGIA